MKLLQHLAQQIIIFTRDDSRSKNTSFGFVSLSGNDHGIKALVDMLEAGNDDATLVRA